MKLKNQDWINKSDLLSSANTKQPPDIKSPLYNRIVPCILNKNPKNMTSLIEQKTVKFYSGNGLSDASSEKLNKYLIIKEE